MPPFSCTQEDAEVLHNYARSLLLLVSTFRWLTDAYVVEFFVEDHWHKLPTSWQEALGDLELDEVALYLSGEKTSRHASVWPLSLLAFCVATRSLALNRHPDQGLSGPGEDPELDHCFRYHVKDKKRHEIKTLANIIHGATVSSSVNRVVDVGGGQGHLTRLLSVGYGLKVMSIEAAGCHVSGATKVDRKVEVLRQRREKKGLLEIPKPSNAPQTPVHIVCTITPDISVTEFISIVNQSLNREVVETVGKQPEGQTAERFGNELGSRDVLTSCGDDESWEFIEMDGDMKCRNLSKPQPVPQRIGDASKQVEQCGGIETEKDGGTETYNLGDGDSQSAQHQYNYAGYQDSIVTLNTAQAEEPGVGAKILGATNPEGQCSEHSISKAAAIDIGDQRTPRGESGTIGADSGFEPFSLVGLHTCGDLGPTIMRVFVNCPEARVLALVGCCYMKMKCVQPMRELAGTQSGRDICSGGFPMSRWVDGLGGQQMTFEPLELACHFFDYYFQRLRDRDPSLILQAYRAMLEILIQEQQPELVKKHAGIRRIKKATASIKKKPMTGFESYAEAALMKLELTFDPDAVRRLDGECKPRWKHLIIFHALRQCLAPIIESLVLVDRMLYLLENGIESQLTAVFDPSISPRNFLLQASK